MIDLSLARALPDLPKDYANDVREPDVEQEPAARPKDTKSKWEGVVPNLNILLLIVGSRGASRLHVPARPSGDQAGPG